MSNTIANSFTIKNVSLCLLFTLLFNGNGFSQSSVNTPKSIYTYLVTPSKNSFSSLNRKLNLKGFHFVYVDLLALDVNQFLTYTTYTNTTSNKPSLLIYDDYKAYRDENLLKGFRLKYDPTRWNLQCPSPLSVQPTLPKN